MRIERSLILPDFEDREVICAHCMLQHVEAKIAFFLPAGFRQSSEEVRCVRALAADVDMRDDVCRAIVCRRRKRTHGQCFVWPLVVIAQANRIECASPLFRVGSCGVRIECLLIRPGLDDCEVSWPSRLLKKIEADKAQIALRWKRR